MKKNLCLLKLKKLSSISSLAKRMSSNYNDSFRDTDSVTKKSKFFECVTKVNGLNEIDSSFFKKIFEKDKQIEKTNFKVIVPNFGEKDKNSIKIISSFEEKDENEKRKIKNYRKIQKENFANTELPKEKKFQFGHNQNLNTKKNSSKLKNFKKIFEIVSSIFLGQDIKEKNIKELNQEQLFILCKILKKKYDLKFEIENCSDKLIKKIFEIKENFANKESKKRIEEKIKFIYKNTLKSLKEKYINENNFKKNKKSIESFYKYYFEDLGKELNLPLISFYDPLIHKNGSKQKSLNFKFLKIVFSSKKFKSDFFKFLLDNFKSIYQNILIRKVDSFFYKIEKKYADKCNKVKNDQMINYLKNNKVKFPWSFFEINDAIHFFMDKIDSFEYN